MTDCDSGEEGWVQVNVCARMSICSAETRAIRLVCAQKRGCASRIPPRKTLNLFYCERCASSARACLGCNRRLARLGQFRQTPAFRSTSTTPNHMNGCDWSLHRSRRRCHALSCCCRVGPIHPECGGGKFVLCSLDRTWQPFYPKYE